jgi:hypothetical protein
MILDMTPYCKSLHVNLVHNQKKRKKDTANIQLHEYQ